MWRKWAKAAPPVSGRVGTRSQVPTILLLTSIPSSPLISSLATRCKCPLTSQQDHCCFIFLIIYTLIHPTDRLALSWALKETGKWSTWNLDFKGFGAQLKVKGGLPWGLRGKESTCKVGDMGQIPGSGRPSGEGNGNPLQSSCLGNPIHRGACWVMGSQRDGLSS